MKFSEYEERFQRPAPSWHQILMVNQGPNRKRRRRRRCLVAAALMAAIMLTIEISPHHAAHGHAGKGSASEPAFDVLLSDFSHILEKNRSLWLIVERRTTVVTRAPFLKTRFGAYFGF
jgi:hypothetical protein